MSQAFDHSPQQVSAPAALRDGRFSRASPALERLGGWSGSALIGTPVEHVIVPLEESHFPDFGKVKKSAGWRGLVAVVHEKTKVPKPALAELVLSNEEGELLLELRRLEEYGPAETSRVETISEALEKAPDSANAQRLGLILEHMPGFCYTVDVDLVFTSSLGAGLGHLQLDNNELVGVSLLDLWGTKDPTYEPLVCHFKALAGHSQTYQDVCLGRSLEYQLRPLREPSGRIVGVMGVGFDVTERQEAKERQARLTAQLRQAQKMEAIGRLAGGVAHDFNNLLTCMMGNLTLAERLLSESSPVASHLAECNRAVESAATLTRQLLAFGRKQVINPRALNLSTLITNVEGMLRRLIGESIQLSTRCPPDVWTVKADPGQIEQVLVNLVVNARDAITGHGRVAIRTENQRLSAGDVEGLTTLSPGEYVVLTVEDTGRGMSDVVQSKLFEPFFTTKEMGEGTGLGLATVYGAVQQNGGTVVVDSQLGHGSRFRIFLPRITGAEADEKAGDRPSLLSEELLGGNETILLVEDEPLVLELAHCTLKQLGYQVLPCSGPDEALRRFSDYHGLIDLLVTDVIMPRMNGKELASRVTSLRPGIAVLFSSGYGENIIAKQGVLDEGVNFIGKPYRPAELAAKVRSVLDTAATRANDASARN